jgi:hypothetical protein
MLNERLEAFYRDEGLSEFAIAYRKLGRSNYNFANDVVRFVTDNAPCAILCFDVSDFFGHLNHALLKARLKRILQVSEISRDWYAVFRSVTRYSAISLNALRLSPVFGSRLAKHSNTPIASIREIRNAGIEIQSNHNDFGIPQGTPISAVFSNLYMIDFDRDLSSWCKSRGGLYRRYSDDILIVCPIDAMAEAEAFVNASLAKEKLKLNDKTDRCVFDGNQTINPQYLGFEISPNGLLIRASSLSRQWRKLRRNIRRTWRVGQAAIAAGAAEKIYTRKLYRRFTALRVRNFSSYARRSSSALGSPGIMRQVRRLERHAEKEIAALKRKP